jgi:hypothetical protein
MRSEDQERCQKRSTNGQGRSQDGHLAIVGASMNRCQGSTRQAVLRLRAGGDISTGNALP